MSGSGLGFVIDGEPATLEQVHAWEKADALKACRKLGVDPAGKSLAELRSALLERKLQIGNAGMLKKLRWQLVLSGLMSALLALLSFGARKVCTLEIRCGRGSAEDFKAWFLALNTDDRQAILLNGEPQHYVLRRSPQGWQEVVETDGGAPLPAHFFIRYGDTSHLKTPPDPAFPVEIAGCAYSPGNINVAAVRHMARDEGTGFIFCPLVELPWLTPGSIISQNRWHLATEFSNWITAWIEETDPPAR